MIHLDPMSIEGYIICAIALVEAIIIIFGIWVWLTVYRDI
jgi:hypothetical protein